MFLVVKFVFHQFMLEKTNHSKKTFGSWIESEVAVFFVFNSCYILFLAPAGQSLTLT